jgi:hypothetical protein
MDESTGGPSSSSENTDLTHVSLLSEETSHEADTPSKHGFLVGFAKFTQNSAPEENDLCLGTGVDPMGVVDPSWGLY